MGKCRKNSDGAEKYDRIDVERPESPPEKSGSQCRFRPNVHYFSASLGRHRSFAPTLMKFIDNFDDGHQPRIACTYTEGGEDEGKRC